MENGVRKESNGNFSAPLPFRKDGTTLSNNYEQARKRAENLGRSLKRDPKKLEDFLQFMENILKNNHAELAPPIKDGEEVWYLPIFGVYHAKKLSKIRVVFDSSAKYHGICLNDILLKGPDLTNNLVSVLSKFRIGFVAPVILGGRLIMRQALQNASVEWDDPLPEYLMNDWQVWKQSLKDLETLEIRRSFTETSLGDCSKCELHIFSDASKDAIASVAYIRTFNYNGHSQLGFVLGKSKLAPNHGHTIPRLEFVQPF
ncbi:Hypothetical predicted protein [Mytilus galloprovincialis]|uniref:Uncharacterized protein n=1 Tax=Mytilus galloprovincialis TaxID=29158 RepID=A0A8B6GG42_MYTGA|nr:Hypothetical predicted protein [Mytilus galloprovincialis]